MNLTRVMIELRPSENVAPDLSSYDAMVAKWRGSGVPPTRDEVRAKWDEIAAADAAVAYIPKQEKARLARGASDSEMIQALWDQVVNNDPAGVDKIKVILAKIKTDFPKPS